MKVREDEWTLEITPRSSLFALNLRNIWRYRDLLILFVKRDIVTFYKQTILGPLWFVIQPILTTFIFMVVFGKIAKLSTDGLPPVLFYLSGIVIWNYFSECIRATSGAFTANEDIFGKVYFPRVIVPLSTVIANLIRFGIQLALFSLILAYYVAQGVVVDPSWWVLLFPLLIALVAGLSLGFGMIVSSLTTKYRDMTFLVTFGIQLLMYATPVIYPLSEAPEKYRALILANPMSPIIEAFRYTVLGAGSFNGLSLAYSAGFTVVVLILGLLVFNRTEKTFMDVV